MKTKILVSLVLILIGTASLAQLTGTKTIPGSYPTVASAIAALNSAGAGPGGVVFNVAAGHSETLPSSLAGYITTTSGSAANPITFQKSGTGANPVITSSTGKGSMDAIIAICGSDYVTFDGVDLVENPGNGDADQFMEWGYAILKASGANGSQFIRISNCAINLYIYHTTSTGIYSGNHTSTSLSELVITDVGGTNSRIKIFGNTIGNCYNGIMLKGFDDLTAPYQYYDQDNEIGKDGGNIVTNVAGADVDAGYGIFTRGQNNLKVANNVITSIMGGSGTPYGIYLTNTSNGSYDLYGNTVSMQFWGEGTTGFYPVWADMGANGTSNVANIYNNTITNCTFPTATTGYTYLLYLANIGVTASVYGNMITNNTIGAGDVSATGRIYYLYCNKNTTGSGPITVHDNQVTGNSRIQMSPAGGFTQFIIVTGKGTQLDMFNNTISDNVVASNSGTYLLNSSFDVGIRNVYNNTVSNISRAEGVVYGLYNYNVTSMSGTGRFYRNKITNIEGLTAGSNIYGIYNSASGSPSYFYNNTVSDLRANGASSTSVSVAGFYQSQGAAGFFNNTIYLKANSTGTNFSTTAFYSNGASNQVDLRNNILVNTSFPKGTGKTTVLRLNYTNLVNFSQLTNYNDLYAGNPGSSNLIYFDGTNSDQTLSAYQSRVFPREVQSVTELPPFQDNAVGSTDVHLKTGLPTQCEAGGTILTTPVAVTTDIDSDPRYPNTGYPAGTFQPHAPDLGADEFGGLSTDIVPPAISFTPLQSTSAFTARTLTAEITDGSGVPTTGPGLPMLYWKINSGIYQGVQGTYVTGNTFTFTFGSGVAQGDIVSYYIAAQDLAAVPNIGIKPSAGASGLTPNPPACLIPPSAPASYTIMLGISGTFHVGAGKYYVSLTDAAADINSKVIAGPVTLILDDALYTSETLPVTFNSNPGSSATNVLTIKPNAGVSPVFYGSVPTGILNFNGIDFVVLDGSNNGTSTKNLTTENYTTMAGAYGIAITSNGGMEPSTNITIKNCIVKCRPVHAYGGTIAIKVYGANMGCDNIFIDNNMIHSAFFGVQMSGSSTGSNHDCQITNNIIGSEVDAEAITSAGVDMQYSDNTLISGNDIRGPYSGSLNIGQTGVYMGAGVTNTKVRKNRIHGFYHNADDGWGVTGIWYASDASSLTEISDNLIYDIKSPGMNPGVGMNITYGIFVRSGGNLQILHNTINLTGAWLSNTYDASSACLGFYYQATGNNFEVRNNIFRNGMQCIGSPNIMGRAYGIMVSGGPGMFSLIDNNDYFIDGYNGMIAQQYTNGSGTLVQFPTLASWQTFTGQEASSVTIDPAFLSDVNLVPTSVPLNNKGVFLPYVPTDYSGVNRNSPSDIGAYEFGSDPQVLTIAAGTLTGNSAEINGSVNPAGNSVTLFFDYGTTTGYGYTTSGAPFLGSGTVTIPFSAVLNGLTANTTYHYRARSVTSTGLISFGSDMTFTTLNSVPDTLTVNGTIANGETNCYNATNTITIPANGGSFTVTAGGSVTFIAGQKIRFLPGTTILANGYMHGYITTSGQYCLNPSNPVVAAGSGESNTPETYLAETPSLPKKDNRGMGVKVFPNPVVDRMRLELTGLQDDVISRAAIFSMSGVVLKEFEMQGSVSLDIALTDLKPGIYFFRISDGKDSKVLKIIKL